MPVGNLYLVDTNGPSTFPAARGADGSIRTANSFGDYGIPDDYVGAGFDPSALYYSERSTELEFRASYFHCKQHDHKNFRWDGSGMSGAKSIRTTQPMIGSQAPSHYIPLSQRRPSAPYRIGRKQVTAFTGMLFGEGRWPQFRSKDPETQAAATELSTASNLPLTAIAARNLGGSSGTAGMSWCFVDGKPRVKAHRGARVHVIAWADEDGKIPAHVIELKKTTVVAVDPADGKIRPQEFWQRIDWTMNADVVFKSFPVVSEDLPAWVIDQDKSRIHNDGFCHFVWVTNLPSEDDSEDGACDYGETYEQMDSLDELNSVHVTGTKLNLDPTLLLKLDANDRENTGVIRKGTDNAIVTSTTGGAEYLQLNDTQLGERTISLQRQQVLEVNDCVLPDPDKVAAAASSGEALKIVYAPMIARCDVLRMHWGPAIEHLMNQMLRSWRKMRSTTIQVPVEVEPANDDTEEVTDDEVPVTEDAVQDLTLSSRILRQPSKTNPGHEEEIEVAHHPGAGDVTVEWGPYFKITGTEKQATIGSIGQATGGKPVLSQRAGVELTANLFDRDADDEWQAIQAEEAEKRANEGGMFGGTGGEIVPGDGPPPEDAHPGTAALVELAPTDKIKTMTVNEVRAKAMGLGPLMLSDGSQDPDGSMPFVAYMAKLEAQGTVQGEIEGGGVPVDDDLPVPPPKLLPGMGE